MADNEQYDGPGPYGFVPTRWICILFVVLFAISGLLHLFQVFRYRTWWMVVMVLGCIGETAGWSGRLWSSFSPRLLDPYLMQITSTIISPSLMSAANFTILGLIFHKLGTQYSWLSPRWYLIIFVSLDVAALVVQSIGGAKAASAAKGGTDAEAGGRIMLWGIVLQIIALSIYVGLAIESLIRVHFNKPVRKVDPQQSQDTLLNPSGRALIDRNTKIMILGLIINTVFLYIRGIYRTIELNDGWNGAIITNETLFNWLDGMPITVCTYAFNFIHPGVYIPSTKTEEKTGKDEKVEV